MYLAGINVKRQGFLKAKHSREKNTLITTDVGMEVNNARLYNSFTPEWF